MKKKNLIDETSESFVAKNKFAMLGSGIGFVGMISYAFKVKSGFWKGLGFALIGSIAGSALGAGIDAVMLKSKDKTESK